MQQILLFASLQKNLENFQNEIHSKCRTANEKDGVGDGSRHEFKQTVNKNLQTLLLKLPKKIRIAKYYFYI